MSDYDPVLQWLEAEDRAKTEEVRQMLYADGRPDLVAKLDAKMRDIESGVYGARSAWHSISHAQRTALRYAESVGGRLVRSSLRPRYISVALTPDAEKPIGIKTVRNLCAHDLMAWDGGAFNPEGAAVVTERGRFVLKHGPLPDGQRF